MDALLQRYVDEKRLAGAVALVLRDGQPVYERAVGWSDKEAGRPMAMDTIFRIASQTKAITSVAVLSLMEEGRAEPRRSGEPLHAGVRHDDRVGGRAGRRDDRPGQAGDHDPRPADAHARASRTAPSRASPPRTQAKGLGPAAGRGWYFADKDDGVCPSIDRLATLPFVAQPGEEWVYGYNTDILGCVVERVTGQSLDAVVRARSPGRWA